MAKTAIIFGMLLMLLGVATYLAAPADHRSPTALIPTLAGVILAVCGVLALDDAKRKHAMHAAAVVGLLGFLAPLGRVIPQAIKGSPPHGMALFSMLAMAGLCLIFLIMCVRSFRAARKARA